jgi:hypothetical protein
MTIATRTVSYQHEKTALTGSLAWDDALPLPRPGILLVHGFTHDHVIPGAIPGVEFNAVADTRSFAAVGAFLDELAAAS